MNIFQLVNGDIAIRSDGKFDYNTKILFNTYKILIEEVFKQQLNESTPETKFHQQEHDSKSRLECKILNYFHSGKKNEKLKIRVKYE